MEIDSKIVDEIGKRKSHTATYICIYEDGKTKNNQSGACHAELRDGLLGYPDLIVNKRCYPDIKSEGTTAFYDWLLNRSPWADAYITKDAETADNSHIILTTSVTRNMLGTALVATRGPWEKASRFHLYHELVKLGMEEHVAYAVITFYKLNDNGQVRLRGIDGHHWPFIGSNKRVNNFLKKENWPKYVGKLYKEVPGWGQASEHFYSDSDIKTELGRSYETFYEEALSEVEGTVKTKSLNIFQKEERKEYNAKASILALKRWVELNWDI